MGGNKDEEGVIEMPYSIQSPVISEFVEFMCNHDLVITFDWGSREDGHQWRTSENENKYEKLDIVIALKLLTAVISNDRFNDGALISAFESGVFPKIIDQLVTLLGSQRNHN